MQDLSTREDWVPFHSGRLFVKQWCPDTTAVAPPIVLFHDSLGCVELWRDFPQRLARATGRTVIAYDRAGFGRSDPWPEPIDLNFINDEAGGAFRAVHRHLGLSKFIAFGHSVGGGMAAVCATRYPDLCRALVTVAAQAFVEERTLEGIRRAQRGFSHPEQFERLERYHGTKAAWVLSAWVDSWLSDAFRNWELDDVLREVRCPVLAIHGDSDEYGSLEQTERIVSRVQGPATKVIVPDCGHVPHRAHPEAVLETTAAFLERHRGGASI